MNEQETIKHLDQLLTEGDEYLQKQAFDVAVDSLEKALPENEKVALVTNFQHLVEMFGDKHSKVALLKVAKDLTEQEMLENNPELKKQAELNYNLGQLAAQELLKSLETEE